MPDGPDVVLDWQTPRRGPGGVDLARFLIDSLSVSQRRADETRLLRTYHTALIEAGVSDYSFEACWRDVGLGSLFRFSQLVSVALRYKPGSRRKRLRAAFIEHSHAMLEDHNVLELLP